MKASLVPSFAALTALCAVSVAQTSPGDPFEFDAQGSAYNRVQTELEVWRERHGANWRVAYEKHTGYGRFLYGGSSEPLFKPRSDADFAVLARNALLESMPITGMQPGTLVETKVIHIPLAAANTTDKMSVQFHQALNGVRVLSGYASVLFDMEGRLLSVDSTGLPNLAGLSTTPTLDSGRAFEIAVERFSADTGLPATSVSTPELVIEQHEGAKLREPRLAWQVEVHFTGDNLAEEGYFYRVDAHDGSILNRSDAVHELFDVSGTVTSLATPGVLPDGAGNPEVSTVMPHIRVNSAQGNAIADSNGNFNIVGATAPLSVTVSYDGTYVTTNNIAQADYSLTTTLNSASGNTILMNPGAVNLVTPEANAFNWIGQMRDWVRAVNPSDATADFNATSNVNLADTCNAFYNGGSVNFYPTGGGCANTAYSSVVIHEMGHWMNDRYSSGNGPDGFGEGNADNFSTHILDNPIVGQNFFGAGSNIRNANNNRQFCGDCCGGCHGGVHANGEVLMGALWKVRNQLKGSLGNAGGITASNALFSGWMNAYNDSAIQTIIETHYLTLDDDDGDINNGTPNYPEIDAGFKQQGFPGFQLAFVSFNNVAQLGNTTDEGGPYSVTADITATFNPPVTAPTVFYRVDGGAFQSAAMSLQGGNTYVADIPGQVAPSKVEYYLEASDNTAQGNVFPEGGASSPYGFYVGLVTSHFAADFESGTAGWTHGSNGGTQDDWHLSSQYGVDTSFGKVGDPTDSSPGQNVWGNDLGPNGWNGSYSSNVSNFLNSPNIDLSGQTDTRLTFRRWLQVEAGIFDQAVVSVNGTPVWSNPSNADLIDTSWVEMDIDISALADNNPNVQVTFSLDTDGGTAFGGWNIDDFEIISVSSTCPQPTAYCTAKFTSILTSPAIGSTGTPSITAGNFSVTLDQAIPTTNGIVFWGAVQAATPFQGGTLCVAPPTTRGPITLTSASGTASFTPTITNPMVGTSLQYQWWFRDVADAFGSGLSNGLSVTFCD